MFQLVVGTLLWIFWVTASVAIPAIDTGLTVGL
jgi:hypothetical protein